MSFSSYALTANIVTASNEIIIGAPGSQTILIGSGAPETITFPNATDTLATIGTTTDQTLNHTTLNNATFNHVFANGICTSGSGVVINTTPPSANQALVASSGVFASWVSVPTLTTGIITTTGTVTDSTILIATSSGHTYLVTVNIVARETSPVIANNAAYKVFFAYQNLASGGLTRLSNDQFSPLPMALTATALSWTVTSSTSSNNIVINLTGSTTGIVDDVVNWVYSYNVITN